MLTLKDLLDQINFMKLFKLLEPKKKTNNIIYNSPHSGEKFPAGFLKTTSIDKNILLASADSFVDQLYADVFKNGSFILSNIYSRSFMDTNREALELDPVMFNGEITEKLHNQSNKVKLGFGSIAKLAVNREDIYKDKIPFDQALKRLESYYYPIHQKLTELLETQFDEFGYSLLIDCHSMPSYKFLGQDVFRSSQPDIILGNLHNKSCHPVITDYLTTYFEKHDLTVACNTPFAGGYNTQEYGRPKNNRHAIQIEIKKSLYMDEFKRIPNNSFERLKNMMRELSYNLNKDIDDLLNN